MFLRLTVLLLVLYLCSRFLLLAIQICWSTRVGFHFNCCTFYFQNYFFFLFFFSSSPSSSLSSSPSSSSSSSLPPPLYLLIYILFVHCFLDFLSFLPKIFFSCYSIFKAACLTSLSSVNEFCPRTTRNTRALFGDLVGIAIWRHRFGVGNLKCVLTGKEKDRVYKDRKGGGFQRC